MYQLIQCPFLRFQMLVPAVVFFTLGKCSCCWNESIMVRIPLTVSTLEDQSGILCLYLCVWFRQWLSSCCWLFSPFTVFVFYCPTAFKLINVGFSWHGMWTLIRLYQLNRGPIVNELWAARSARLSSLHAAQLQCGCMLLPLSPL